MKIEFKTDTVEYLYKTGKDFVKQTMPKASAEKIIADGKPEEVEHEGFNIRVGNYYFKAEVKKSKTEREK